MAKGASKPAAEELECQEVSPVNADELEYALYRAERRVLEIQAKLHRWAGEDPHRRFDDLFVRHEAPVCRAGVKGPGRWAVAAAWRS
jgi:hypothetical protein